MVLLRTKIRPPTRPYDLIDRPQLDRIDELRRSRLTLVQAPAGYGKSSLLLQWFHALQRQAVDLAWIALDASERDPVAFVGYLIDALRAAGHTVDAAMPSLMTRDRYASTNVVITRLANSLVGAPRPMFLFLDDVHHLIGTTAGACLRTLIECAPPELHLVLASREQLDIPVARQRALGQLVELGINDLRFANREIVEFLAKSGHATLDGATIDSLETRTEGWIAGIKLASIALQWQPQTAQRLERFSGARRQVTDFFAEDVLACQPADLQDFLLKTSLLERLSPALCDAVTGQGNARQLLDRCESNGLFLISLDAERTWYRYHTLFAEFLRRRFADQSPGALATLHCRASDWLLEQGFHIEAIEHALAGHDPVRAAKILESRCNALAGSAQDWLIPKFAAQIPPHIQAFYPRIMLALAWEHIMHWEFDEARSLLAASRARLDEMRRIGGMPEREIRDLGYLLLHREMMLAQFQDSMPTAEGMCETLAKEYCDAHPYLKASFYVSLMNIHREQYKLAELDRFDALAREQLQRANSPHMYVHEVVAGPSWFVVGRTDAAIQCLANGLEIAGRIAGKSSAIGACVALPLAEIYYERNETARASELVTAHLKVGSQVGYVDQLVSGWLTLARLQRLDGDLPAALRTLDEAAALAARFGFERLRLWVGAERIKFLLRAAQPDDAVQVARDLGIPRDAATIVPGARVTSRDEARALAWLRLAQTQNRIAEAIRVAKQWRTFFWNARAVRSLIRWDILIAELLFLDGQQRAAQRALRQAVANAAPGRFVRSFLDEGAPIATLLFEQSPAGVPVSDATDKFAAELAIAFEREGGRAVSVPKEPEEAVPRLGGAVSAKEAEILTMVGSGMFNREIGEKLGMTEGSVKWYLQQIYNKIGVRRRSQAVDRARQFGLIA
jgi:LuxR family transcriptional regulator, maltose regulon positive regulatory protein